MTREALIEAMARAIAREAGHDPDAMIPGATKEAGRIWRQFIGAASASLSAIEASGAVVVPVEPTDAMSFDPDDVCVKRGQSEWTAFCEIYAAMIKASPYRSTP